MVEAKQALPNQQQEITAQQLAQSALEKGRGSIISTNLDPNVFERASYLLADTRKRGYYAATSSLDLAEKRAQQSFVAGADIRRDAAQNVFKSSAELSVDRFLNRANNSKDLGGPQEIAAQQSFAPGIRGTTAQERLAKQSLISQNLSPQQIQQLQGARPLTKTQQAKLVAKQLINERIEKEKNAAGGVFDMFSKAGGYRVLEGVSEEYNKPRRFLPYQEGVGFEERKPFLQTLSREEAEPIPNRMELPKETKYLSIGGLFTTILDEPITKLSKKYGQSVTGGEIAKQEATLFGLNKFRELKSKSNQQSVPPLKIDTSTATGLFYSKLPELKGKVAEKQFKLTADTGIFFVPFLRDVKTAQIIGEGATTATNKDLSITNRLIGGAEAVGFGSLLFGRGIFKGVKYLEKPINIKRVNARRVSGASLLVKQGDDSVIASGASSTIKIPGYNINVKRSRLLLENFNPFQKPLNLKEESALRLLGRFGQDAKVEKIGALTKSEVITRPGIIEDRLFFRPASSQERFIFTGSRTINLETGRIIGKERASLFGASVRKDRIILDSPEFAALTKAEKSLVRKGLRVEEQLGKEVSIGDSISIEIARLSKKGKVKYLPYGKRISRQEGSFIKDLEVNKDEVSLISGRITSRAEKVSPLGRPKQITTGKGLIKRVFVKSDKETGSINQYGKSSRSPRVTQKQEQVETEILSNLISKSVQESKRAIPKASVIQKTSTEIKKTDSLIGGSIYAGTGLYERTEEKSYPLYRGGLTNQRLNNLALSQDQNKNSTSFGFNVESLGRTRTTNLQIRSTSQTSRQKSSAITSLILSPKSDVRNNQRISQPQLTSQRSALRLRTQQRQRTLSRINFGFSPTTFPRPEPTNTKVPGFPLRLDEEEDKKKERGFIPEAKISGRFVSLTSKPVSERKALAIGSLFTDKTLSRTFRINPTKQQVKKEKSFIPVDLSKFRNFRQVRGRRIGLDNTFIERSKYALERSEVGLITPLARAGQRRKRSRR